MRSRRPASTCGSLGPFDAAGVPELVHVDVHPGGRGHTHLDLRYLFDGGPPGDADPAPPEGESQEVGWFDWAAAIAVADHGLRGALRRLPRATPEFAGVRHARSASESAHQVTVRGIDEVAYDERMFDTGGVGFNNPSWTWSELEAALSGPRRAATGAPPGSPSWNAGGDGPAWSRKRQPFEAPDDLDRRDRRRSVPYAELHCHSNFSFLDGASHPEELATEAARLGLEALALTDHDGFYGVVRFAEAARAVGLPTVFGAEITLTPGPRPATGRRRSHRGATRRPGRHRPGARLPRPRSRTARTCCCSPTGPTGYARLATGAQPRPPGGGEGGAAVHARRRRRRRAPGTSWVLTGCRKGAVPAALVADGPAAAAPRAAAGWSRRSGATGCWSSCGTTATRSTRPATTPWPSSPPARRRRASPPTTSTTPRRPSAGWPPRSAAVRARRSLDELDPWLPAAAGAHLRSGAEQARRFARYPGVVERAAEIGRAAAFDLVARRPEPAAVPVPATAS